MDNNNKNRKTSGALIIWDLIENVCRYLDTKDLCSVAQVCRMWNQAVKRELEYRSPHRILAYENYDIYIQDSFVKIKPYLVLLFVQQNFEMIEPREKKILREYIKHFPHILIILGSDKVYTDKNIINATQFNESTRFALFNYYEIPGLMLPNHRTLEIKVSRFTREEIQIRDPKSVINELVPKNKQFKTILMIFTFACDQIFIENFLMNLKERFQNSAYTLWGSELFLYPYVNDFQDINMSKIGFLGLSITAPNITSYSLVLRYDVVDNIKIYNTILGFKNNIKLKQHSFGFITGPTFECFCINESDEEMAKQEAIVRDYFFRENYEKTFLFYMKKIFPNTPFVSTFRDNMFQVFSGDSRNVTDQDLIHDGALAILIITYY